MENSKVLSKLFRLNVLDAKDELDELLERHYAASVGQTVGKSEREAMDFLQASACKGPQQHEEVQLGLLYALLTDAKSALKSYRDMTFISRDGLNTVLVISNRIIYEKWLKLEETPQSQMLWFARELVRNGQQGVEALLISLTRQIAGGDISSRNVWLCEATLDIFVDYRAWLEKQPGLVSHAVYTYLRLIVDHVSQSFAALRQKEVDFCVKLLRERWADCMLVGRDLVRLLQYVARIPEFDKLWLDILTNPQSLSPHFQGIQQLMQTKTSRKYLVSRLTPEMETKLVFLSSKVKFGRQRHYQEWFQRQYLSTAESQTLRCDLIRYICAVIHPSNEQLCSDVIPRWAIIGWLLTTCTSNVAASSAKLSLFYDWLFFDPERDSIMNIEPGILVTHNSLRPHPAITATLLDFMCRMMNNFSIPLAAQVKQGFYTSLRSILDKKVLPSLSPLFDNPKLDKELRSMIQENFAEFCSNEVREEPPAAPSIPVIDLELNGADHSNHSSSTTINDGEIAEFSDEEDDVVVVGSSTRSLARQVSVQKQPLKLKSIDIQPFLDQLDGELRMCLDELQNEKETSIQCDNMEKLVQLLLTQQEDVNESAMVAIATCLSQILIDHFTNSLLPQDTDDDESMEDSLGTPLFVIFRNVCAMTEEDPSRQPLLQLLVELYKRQPRIGYHFLYFLRVSKAQSEEKMAAYRDFCRAVESHDLKSMLIADLQLCQEDDVRLFTYLIPDIYMHFQNIAIGNTDILHLVVSCIDSSQLQDLVCEILRGHLTMFRKDTLLSVLNASLEWESIEQWFLWQLLSSHSISLDSIMPIIPKLDFASHAEALTSIMLLLKQERPSAETLRQVLCREAKKNDMFTVSVLKSWAQDSEDRLVDLLHAQLIRSSAQRKKHKGSMPSPNAKDKDRDQPSVDHVLAHLDQLRRSCQNVSFLSNELMQQALQQVQQTCNENQKSRYGDLLALAEDFEEVKTRAPRLRQVPSRRAAAAGNNNPSTGTSRSGGEKKARKRHNSDSSDDSSEDEELSKPPKAKKSMKAPIIDDDE